MGSKSLTALLTRRLIFIQAAIILVTMIGIAYQLRDNYVSYIDSNVPLTIARAMVVDHDGELTLRVDKKLNKLLDGAAGLWFVAEDEAGRRLEYGEIPAAYRGLAASVSQLQQANAHSNRAPYALTMIADVVNTSFGRIHILCGGAPTADPEGIFLVIVHYLGWRLALPLALLTLIVIPWVIRRSMSGVEGVARQAQAIDINDREVRLAKHAVPRELQPLVTAFNAALERLNEGYDAHDRFLASAAHELRAPIAILGVQIETLDAGADRARLLAGIVRLSNLAEQLLDLQRLGKHPGKFEALDLVALSREVTADVAPMAIDAGYELALDAPGSAVMVMGDRLSLSRVLTNLLQNAIAYGGRQGLITIDVKADGVFGVRDQGPGIPVAERQRVFEPFHRLRPSSTGAGLGLHLVQEIVALHGGRVELTESPEGGAWFRVKLHPAPGRQGGASPG
ncbi:sensor histidine kinase [Dyella flagellata]|uniref:histidine kinase n=1 Tax=Dyella flagellata TaxID=1867833 RepID=A0ABQ5XBB7_9GAMM|nr:HAMP domain-containing sensor histidine kinase [Dyella flagellata]GLQ88587.1 two-component sensor histidine kinase [Dyella flagellata]